LKIEEENIVDECLTGPFTAIVVGVLVLSDGENSRYLLPVR
jgi:hypothetical protein